MHKRKAHKKSPSYTILKTKRIKLLHFKQPSIDKSVYGQSLYNISETLSKKTAQINREEPIRSLINLIHEMITIHAETHGVPQLKQDLRLLGNAIRIASQSSEKNFIGLQQISGA